MKRILGLLLLVTVICSFCGCSLLYDYESYAVGSFDVGYSSALNNAFLGAYNWDGTEENMNIVIPESYNGIKITELGGYFGRGVPSPFTISLTDNALNALCENAMEWQYVSDTANIDNCNIQYLRFELNVSKYISEVENFYAGDITVAKYVENGEVKYNAYVLTCYVTCDADNEKFYAKDGKLYFKETDTLVENIIYEDFYIEAQ